MLDKNNRLRKRKEFAYLYNNGTAKHTSHLTLVYIPTKFRAIKIGFSVTKKIGKAHIRNLVKRRLRAITREIVSTLKDNFNVVIIAKVGIDSVSFAEMKSQVNYLFEKAGLKK